MNQPLATRILFEDNHLIVINKLSGELVQPDTQKSESLEDTLKLFIKEKENKAGNVYLGVVHRIDRPVSGAVLFAKTSKALSRMNNLLQEKQFHKTYWAIVSGKPEVETQRLTHYLTRNSKNNTSQVFDKEVKDSKLAELEYKLLGVSDFYSLLEVKLFTGRHHQIRAQLSKLGLSIKGDLKYGAARSNHDASISLHARKIEFIHPVTNQDVVIIAPVPNDPLWKFFEKNT